MNVLLFYKIMLGQIYNMVKDVKKKLYLNNIKHTRFSKNLKKKKIMTTLTYIKILNTKNKYLHKNNRCYK